MSTEFTTLDELRTRLSMHVRTGRAVPWLKWLLGFILPRDVRHVWRDPKSTFNLHFRHQVGIIDAMTLEERNNPSCITRSRMARIAIGAGVPLHEVETLLLQHVRIAHVSIERSKRRNT